jgi:hypothetical protein
VREGEGEGGRRAKGEGRTREGEGGAGRKRGRMMKGVQGREKERKMQRESKKILT